MGEYFTNVVKQVEPNSTLFEPEIDLILALMHKTAQGFGRTLESGTFIIDGQEYGKEAKLIVRGNFGDGAYRRRFFRTYDRSSDQIAETSIDELLAWPKAPSRYQRYLKERFFEHEGAVYPHTGVYQDGELLVLVLNATYGRFLASIQAQANDDPYFDFGDKFSEELLYVVSEALCTMMREDATLQRSAAQLVIDCRDQQATDILSTVASEFSQQELPETQAWLAWHDPANSSGELTLPFT